MRCPRSPRRSTVSAGIGARGSALSFISGRFGGRHKDAVVPAELGFEQNQHRLDVSPARLA